MNAVMSNRQLPRTINTVCFKFSNCSDVKQTDAENIFNSVGTKILKMH